MRFYSLVAAAALMSASLAAHADVLYTYAAGGDLAGTKFTIDSAAYLTYTPSEVLPTTSTDLIEGGQDSGDTITGVQFSNQRIFGRIEMNGVAGLFLGSYDIGTDGTYTDTRGDTLQISGSPAAPVAVTPEPSSLALLGTGLLGVAGLVRKRFV